MAKLSGRALGHTGGTIGEFEAITATGANRLQVIRYTVMILIVALVWAIDYLSARLRARLL